MFLANQKIAGTDDSSCIFQGYKAVDSSEICNLATIIVRQKFTRDSLKVASIFEIAQMSGAEGAKHTLQKLFFVAECNRNVAKGLHPL